MTINKLKVDLVIPVFNEAPRMTPMLEVVTESNLLRNIIVVDDGSTDDTSSVAGRFNIDHLHSHQVNRGKGAALATGLQSAKDADAVMFLDADLINLNEQHLLSLIEPVAADPRIGMSVGQFIEGRWAVDMQQKWFAVLNGQRVLSRSFIDRLPDLNWSRFGVEILMSRFALDSKTPVATPYLRGITHVPKEEKFGLLLGFYARMKMYAECLRGHVLYRLKVRRGEIVPIGAAG
ncbi:MAG: glycosyltransferase family 2 protein [Thermaerobacterales bacterium]